MDTFYERIKGKILQEDMIRPGTAVAAGISGGADSMCLFHILRRMSLELPFFLQAVHVHHGLRDTALADQQFVERACTEASIPCTVVRVDAALRAAAWGVGIEEAARRVRYDTFEKVRAALEAEKGVPCRVAVAHHMEDQAETVLFRLCRGTGLAGAGGMQPVNGNIIRPLLSETRRSIEEYLTRQGLSWREDETNEDTGYARNYLRHEIFPRLAQGVNAAASRNLAQFAETCTEADRYLEKVTAAAMARCVMDVSGHILPGKKGENTHVRQKSAFDTSGKDAVIGLRIPQMLQEDPYIRSRILHRSLCVCAGTARDLRRAHVEALLDLIRGENNGQLSMPGGIRACRSGDCLFLYRETAFPEFSSVVAASMNRTFPENEKAYRCTVRIFDGNMQAVPQNQYTKWFDYGKIGVLPVFRTRQPGDRMTLRNPESGDWYSKKLARILLDAGVPAPVRDRIVLPFHGKEVLWIPEIRMGDVFKVSPETEQILEITVTDPAFSEQIPEITVTDPAFSERIPEITVTDPARPE